MAIPQIASALEPTFMFMHHSVGQNLVERGDVVALMQNRLPGSDFTYGWDTDSGSNEVEAIHAFWTGTSAHKQVVLDRSDIIAFKSCFTAGEIVFDQAQVDQYKAWYVEIIAELHNLPDHRFVIMGYVPLRSNATTPERAALNWQFHEWLAQQASGNVHFWNYYEQMIDPELYLIDDYVSKDSTADKHPNADSDAVMGPRLVDYLITVYQHSPVAGVPADADPEVSWGQLKVRFR